MPALSGRCWASLGRSAGANQLANKRGNVAADVVRYKTSKDKVFSCGDMRRGQSLVVWAIREGRQAAQSIDKFLMGRSDLPR